jgi:hypothetical protein
MIKVGSYPNSKVLHFHKGHENLVCVGHVALCDGPKASQNPQGLSALQIENRGSF